MMRHEEEINPPMSPLLLLLRVRARVCFFVCVFLVCVCPLLWFFFGFRSVIFFVCSSHPSLHCFTFLAVWWFGAFPLPLFLPLTFGYVVFHGGSPSFFRFYFRFPFGVCVCVRAS